MATLVALTQMRLLYEAPGRIAGGLVGVWYRAILLYNVYRFGVSCKECAIISRRTMHKKGKRNNLNVSLDERLIEAIDDYWHRKRLPSRTAAIRELLEQAIRANAVDDDKPPVDKTPKRDA